MSDVDIDGALAALSEDLPDEYDPVDSGVEVEAVGGDNPDAESFTGFDPNTLPEDMQAVYRSMQADYTRKTQDLAEMRRSFESFSEAGVDAETALQAVGFLQALDTDPEFAKQVAAQIQQNVGTPDFQQPVTNETSEIDTNSYEGLPPELAQELQAMREFRANMEYQQQHQELVSNLEATEQMIRTTNPQYSESDIEAIYELAYAHQGDLMAAQQAYHGIQQRLLGQYLEQKTVPHGATPTPNAPGSMPPSGFNNLDDAHKAAMEAIRNLS